MASIKKFSSVKLVGRRRRRGRDPADHKRSLLHSPPHPCAAAKVFFPPPSSTRVKCTVGLCLVFPCLPFAAAEEEEEGRRRRRVKSANHTMDTRTSHFPPYLLPQGAINDLGRISIIHAETPSAENVVSPMYSRGCGSYSRRCTKIVCCFLFFSSLSYLSYAHSGHWLFSFVLLGIDTKSRLSSSPTTSSSSYTRASHRVWTGFSSNLLLFWSVSSSFPRRPSLTL